MAIFNEQNVQQDAMAILKANGVNYVRLRLWVDPKDSDGQSYGGGSNDLATTLALAKRAKAQGLKVLLDFHYSDFWTDPGKQFKPKAWQKMNYDQLKVAIHDYTRDTIATFKKRVSCLIWCKSAMNPMAVFSGQKEKAGGKAVVSLIGWRVC